MKYKKLILILSLLLPLSLTLAQKTKAQPLPQSSLYVLSFNVLAPCWASPDNYTPAIAPYLDRDTRRQQIIKFLKSVEAKADLIALQEVTAEEFSYFQEALGASFHAFAAYHDKDYWADWISDDIPWEPNGVALFVKKSRFSQLAFFDLALSQDGNHAAYFEGILHEGAKRIRAASIHLDTELNSNRYQELNALMNLMPATPKSHDIIAGDFNYDTQTAPLHELLVKNHFINDLYALKKAEWTHPFDNSGDVNTGVLDHIISRNLKPDLGQVLNSQLWNLYPNDEDKRVIINLEHTGSDHFPLFVRLH